MQDAGYNLKTKFMKKNLSAYLHCCRYVMCIFDLHTRIARVPEVCALAQWHDGDAGSAAAALDQSQRQVTADGTALLSNTRLIAA
jgi:hypothetical protein